MDQKILLKTTRLARLHLSESEKPVFASELQQVLTHFKQMRFKDQNLIPLVDPLDGLRKESFPPQRESQPLEGNISTDSFLALAPEVQNGAYRVPPVME